MIASPLRLLQLVAIEVVLCAAVLGVIAWIGGNLLVAGMTLSIGGLLFGAGDVLAQRLGSSGAWMVFAGAVTACAVLLRRIARSSKNGLRTLAALSSLFFLLQPPLSIFLDRDDSSATISAAAPLPVINTGAAEDFLLVVLDGYASFDTLRDDFLFESPIRALLVREGFDVVDSAWSPSTRTVVSIASLANIGVPLIDGEELTEADGAVLSAMISGDARLFSMFQAAGFSVIYVESGWQGSVCGRLPDVCVRRPFVDEALHSVIDNSLLGDPAEGWWGHVFALGGLHSLAAVERLTRDLGSNGTNDLIFAHVMLPHPPYVLGSDCEITGVRVFDQAYEQLSANLGEAAREAYLLQVACVDRWLGEIARNAGQNSAVVITGDHGTTLRGQMFRNAATWSAEEISERARVVLATKLPATCGTSPVTSSLQAVMKVSDCLLGTRLDVGTADTTWLLGWHGSARCVMQPRGEQHSTDVGC